MLERILKQSTSFQHRADPGQAWSSLNLRWEGSWQVYPDTQDQPLLLTCISLTLPQPTSSIEYFKAKLLTASLTIQDSISVYPIKKFSLPNKTFSLPNKKISVNEYVLRRLRALPGWKTLRKDLAQNIKLQTSYKDQNRLLMQQRSISTTYQVSVQLTWLWARDWLYLSP